MWLSTRPFKLKSESTGFFEILYDMLHGVESVFVSMLHMGVCTIAKAS